MEAVRHKKRLTPLPFFFWTVVIRRPAKLRSLLKVLVTVIVVLLSLSTLKFGTPANYLIPTTSIFNFKFKLNLYFNLNLNASVFISFVIRCYRVPAYKYFSL
jgi:hypothetical protein